MKPTPPTNGKPTRRTSRATPAWSIETAGAHLPPLGMPPVEFLRDYWQKRPLLIRNAFPDFASPITPEDLAGLACEEAALSRIVAHETPDAPGGTDRWLLRHGPFPEEMFPTLPNHDWTLLVQDVEKWDADVAALLPAFAFLPRWRIDDVMVSFAAPGGSVGAHVDQYDVFLLQGQGRRRWAIDASLSLSGIAPPIHFRLDSDLKLLQRFTPTHTWVLEPGDMLYLPPGVPHHGVAEDACLTFSIGMRAPSAAELLGDFVDTLSADADESLRYVDPDLAPVKDPNEIDAAAMQRVLEALNCLRMNDPERLGDWFGRFITLYRSGSGITSTHEPHAANMSGGAIAGSALSDGAPRIRIEWALEHGACLLRHPWTRMAWRKARQGARLYVGGDDFALPVRDARRLAAVASIDGPTYAALSQAGRDLVIRLLGSGHYQLPEDEEE